MLLPPQPCLPMPHRKILLVEDNPDDVALTLRAFKKNNIVNDVVVAADGQSALDWLFGQGEFAGRDATVQPAFVLLDLKLPKIDGLEVLARLKGDPRTATIPVVMLTSSQEQSDLIQSYQQGVNSYIVKPVNFESFVQAVAELGMYWVLLNQPPATGA